MSDGLSIGNRMKDYERCAEYTLPKRIPVVLRIDGRAFHTLTRKHFGKAWNMDFVNQMIETASTLIKNIQGCSLCYCQSDEISFLLTDYKKIQSDGWFGYDIRKVISISASLASVAFSRGVGESVCFDSRCFSMPQDDVCNYFIWRQQDATRNAIQMLAREHFSHKELHGKSCKDIQEMLFSERGVNFNACPVVRKRGFCIANGELDLEIPMFSQNRDYIERFVFIRED